MATSHGPHHHHPPNTDADYEGPEHAQRDAEMLRAATGESHYGNYQPKHHHSQHQHHHHHHGHSSVHSHHGVHSQYQPDDNYENDETYHRSPVYEQSRKQKNQEYEQDQTQQEEEEDDDPESEIDQYGGRASTDYQSGYESPRNGYLNNYEEDNLHSRDQYMSASDPLPIKIIPLKH